MSEMVDRVAAALCGEELWAALPNGTVTSRFGGRDFFREKARIAIAAMREPTSDMVGELGYALAHDKDVVDCWHGVVDEALK